MECKVGVGGQLGQQEGSMHWSDPEPCFCLCDSEPQCTPSQLGSGTPETPPSPDTHRACDYSVLPAVALNFQTPGSEMDVYQGRFLDNGACGYVLKPAFLRDPNSTFNSRALAQGPWWTPKRLNVRVWPATVGTGAPGLPSPSLPS